MMGHIANYVVRGVWPALYPQRLCSRFNRTIETATASGGEKMAVRMVEMDVIPLLP